MLSVKVEHDIMEEPRPIEIETKTGTEDVTSTRLKLALFVDSKYW